VSKDLQAVHVVSFDLYDTLLIRRALTSRTVYEDVWSALCDRGLELPDRATFIVMRTAADAASAHLDAPTLRQILDHLPEGLLSLATDIEAAEIDVELNQLSLVPGGRERLSHARETGCRIAFVSDMHIGAHHFDKKLRELGLSEEGDTLLVSSDHGVSKSRGGRLFECLLTSEGVPPGHVTHYGNNGWSDVKMARKAGVSGHLCPAANPNRFENLLIEASDRCRELEQVASHSRDIRLHFGAAGARPLRDIDLREESLAEIAASVVGPALVSFVLWVIRRCREESITTIRFLARDGELPCLIAGALPAHITEGLDLGMLEVSRRALTLPAASVIPLEDWLEAGLQAGSFLVQQYDRLPARDVIARVGLDLERHAHLLGPFGITDPEKPLGETGLVNWRRAIQDESVRGVIRQASLHRLSATTAYLRDNLKGMAGTRTAMVDIGWTGQQATMLSAMVRHLGGLDPLHLHVGRLSDLPSAVPVSIESWLFDERERSSPLENPVALFETFCVTTSGGVTGYEIERDGTVSVLRGHQGHEACVLAWGQPLLRDCVLKFARDAGAVMHGLEPDVLLEVCTELLREFWERPSRAEAAKWGEFPYEQDQAGLVVRKLANPYNLEQFKARFSDAYGGIDWKAGSVELSPSPLRQILKVRERYRRRGKGPVKE